VRNLVLVPEALVVAAAVVLLVASRFSWISPGARRAMPAAVALVTLVALGIELWAGATLATYFGGGLVQDRFALFAKAAVLLAATVAFAVVDWTAEDSLSIGLAMPLTWWIEAMRRALDPANPSAIGGDGSLFQTLTGQVVPGTAEVLIALLVTGAVVTLAAAGVFRLSSTRAKEQGLLDRTTGS